MATQRNCETCGTGFQAQRAAAKYCSTRCRVQASRARASGGGSAPRQLKAVTPPPGPADDWEDAEPPPRRSGWGDDPPPLDERPQRGEQELAVWLELEQLKRTTTSLGVAALILARRIDNAGAETGPGLAGLIKEMRATVAAATVTAAGSEDGTDEVRARREQKEREAREARARV